MNNKESGNNEGGHTPEECPDGINIQELCNGTTASPCDCQSFQECQVSKNKEGLANTTILLSTCANTTPHSVHLPMLVMDHCLCWTVIEMATQTDLSGLAPLVISRCTAVETLVPSLLILIRVTLHHVWEMKEVHENHCLNSCY